MSHNPNHEDLLVFGYSCKLFRDDEKAVFIDKGLHLIPWMGDANFHIDRYDGRGVLSNLKAFEAPENGNSQYLDEKEKRIELSCDQERYRSLNERDSGNLEDNSAEAGNVHSGVQIGFEYDTNQVPEQQNHVPIEQPSVKTLANCIEKTAEFILKQGAQMEILMRAKEANNPKFQFLNPDNPYNTIYRQVLDKKKKRPKNYIPDAALMKLASLEVEKNIQILIANLPDSAPGSKPDSSSSDSAYSKLVEKIRESQPKSSTPSPPPPLPESKVIKAAPKPPENPHIVQVYPPPIDVQPLIDKTASYVAKFGSDMLSVIKKKKDLEKFAFLKEDNKYHTFFLYKVALYKEMIADKPEEERRKLMKRKCDVGNDLAGNQKKFPSLKGFLR